MKVFLIVAKGKHQGMPIPITVDLFTIGAANECQLRSNLPGLGRQQCAVVRRENKIFLRDLGSGEPTMVNGSLVPPGGEWPLHKGDRIEVGPFEFMLQFNELNLSKKDLEEWALRSLDQNVEREGEKELMDDEALGFVAPKALKAAHAAASILDKLNEQRGIVKGRLRIGREGDVTFIRINDSFLVEEAEIALIKKELADNLNKPNLRVLLDFKNVKRMSTIAVMMIDEVYSWLKPWGSSLALCRIRPEVQGIMKELTMRNRIPVFGDKFSGLNSRW
jgi:pSer/pThr/pTyr-binding forkhead associated (FHA) protein